MTSRERVRMAINHKEPDYVPMDLCGWTVGTMHVTCMEALREYYGLEKKLIKVLEPYTMTAYFEEDLRCAISCDTMAVNGYGTAYGFPHENWKEWDYFGMKVLVPEGFEVTANEVGGWDIYPQGDRSVSPSGRMPKDGFYFDALIRAEPVEDADKLDYRDNLEEFAPVTDEALSYYAREIKKAEATQWGIIGEFGYVGLGDIGGIPGVGLKHPKGIRTIEDWYMAPILYPEYVHALFSAQVEIAIENLSKIKAVVGDEVDIFYGCGTDFGTQNSLFCSPERFQKMWLPYYKKINRWIHDNTNWKVMKHSCGAIFPLIPLFIEAGIDILNPVQCTATGMDPKRLKEEYGKDIVFCGGGVDVSTVLPFGTPAEVREQVLRRCEIFAPGGGFLFSPSHVIQHGTPVENIVAMIDAVHEFNGKH